jgi:hypothetical protein
MPNYFNNVSKKTMSGEYLMGFEVLMAVGIHIMVFWVIIPCNLVCSINIT